MKKRILSLLLCLACTAVSAQTDTTLSPKMAAFKEYCERVAYAAGVCFTDILIECIENWEPAPANADKKVEKFFYNKELINYMPFSEVVSADTSQVVSMDGHFGFLPPAVDNWITNKCEAVYVAEANVLREGEQTCEYLVTALKPKGKLVYTVRGTGGAELFAVAEHGGLIGFTARVMEVNFRREVINEIVLSDTSGRQSVPLVFKTERNCLVEFTVENLTDKDLSFIVVKKM